MREIKNARITDVSLSMEHGLSSYLQLDYGSASQGFGGYSLTGGAAFIWIEGILNTLEVDRWESLPGTIVRVDAEHSKVHRLGHALKDKWFDPVEAFKPLMRGGVRG